MRKGGICISFTTNPPPQTVRKTLYVPATKFTGGGSKKVLFIFVQTAQGDRLQTTTSTADIVYTTNRISQNKKTIKKKSVLQKQCSCTK